MSRAGALLALVAAVLSLLAPGGAPASAHTQGTSLGDLPVLDFEPQVVHLAPGASTEVVFENTTTLDRIAWWTVVLCHCEPHGILFKIEGPAGTIGDEFLVAAPTYHHYAFFEIHWNGPTKLSWKNEGNRSVVIEYRAGVWPNPGAVQSANRPSGLALPDAAALGAGLGALGVSVQWARADGRPHGRRAVRGAATSLRPLRPRRRKAAIALGALVVLGGLAPLASPLSGAADGPPPLPSRAAPPPEANLTVVKVTAPAPDAIVSDTVTVAGLAYVNETEALRIGMEMAVVRVFLSFNFGPFEPAAGVANWSLVWNTSPLDNGRVWVGAAALDSMGNYSYDWIRVTVSNGAHPVASAAATPSRGFAPLGTTFAGTAVDADGTVELLRWDFGDGTSATGAAANHTFALPGVYRVTLTATDNRGTLGRAFLNITVLDPSGLPQCSARALVQQGPQALTVSFVGEAWDDGAIASVVWDFGDGATNASLNATHTFGAAGNVTVVLRVTDNEGNVGEFPLRLTVPEPLRARTDFPNLSSPGAAVDVRGQLEVYTSVPSGKRVTAILPPLRAGDSIFWRFVACACVGLQNFSFWVESPSGERLLAVGVQTTGVLIIGTNALRLNGSGVYTLVWENGGPGEVELGYTVVTTTAASSQAPAAEGISAALLLGLASFAAAGAIGALTVRRRRRLRARPGAPRCNLERHEEDG